MNMHREPHRVDPAILSRDPLEFLKSIGRSDDEPTYLRLLPAKGFAPEAHSRICPTLSYADKKTGKLIPVQKKLKLQNGKLVQCMKDGSERLLGGNQPFHCLKKLSLEGFAIYAVVNPGGQTADRITEGRVIFWESDDRPKDEQLRLFDEMQAKWGGGFAIETKNSIHCYFRLDAALSCDEWKKAQERLILHFGSDPAIKDLPRLMRVPGFDHTSIKDGKLTRVPIAIIRPWAGDFASWREIDADLPALPEKPKAPALEARSRVDQPISLSSGAGDLNEFLQCDVYPRLRAEQIFNWAGHDFKDDGEKLQGNCPWHESTSGTAFWVTPSGDGTTFVAACPTCTDNKKLNPIDYRHKLNGGHGSPKGRGFVAIVKELAADAGVAMPELKDKVISPVPDDQPVLFGKWIPASASFLNGLQPQKHNSIEDFLKAVPIDRWTEAQPTEPQVRAWLTVCGLHLGSRDLGEAISAEVARSTDTSDAKQAQTACNSLVKKATGWVRDCVKALRKDQRFDLIAGFQGSIVANVIESDPILGDFMSLLRLQDRLRFNSLKKQVEFDGQPLAVGTARVDLTLSEAIDFKCKRDFEAILLAVAKRNSYNPIADYLNSVSGGSAETLENLATKYFGQSDPIYNAMVKKTLIGAVARALSPGCKMDTALILQGKQGAGKSTFFKVLAGDQYFDDSLGNIGDKDEKLKLQRSWFCEWAELETVFKRKDVAATKAFLSSSIDLVRPPYARDIEEMARSGIIVGTTNQDEFLSDSTGNRRFWVVPVVQDIDIEMLRSERDRIWAAAVAAYKAGETWWLSNDEELAASAIAERFLTSDPWADLVLSYADPLGSVTIAEILTVPLQIEISRQDKASQMRVSAILSNAGYKRETKRHNGKVSKVWVKPEPSVQVQEPDHNPKNPDLPAWVVPDAIAVHQASGQKFSISKVKKSKTGEYKLLDSQSNVFLMSECDRADEVALCG